MIIRLKDRVRIKSQPTSHRKNSILAITQQVKTTVDCSSSLIPRCALLIKELHVFCQRNVDHSKLLILWIFFDMHFSSLLLFSLRFFQILEHPSMGKVFQGTQKLY